MTKKDQLEKYYEDLNRKIEQAAETEIREIQEKIEILKEEARQIGETVERTLDEKEMKVSEKKD